MAKILGRDWQEDVEKFKDMEVEDVEGLEDLVKDLL